MSENSDADARPDVTVGPARHLYPGALPADRIPAVLESWAAHGGVGGVVTFCGMVRADKTPQGRVRSIEFTAHEPMAEEAIRALCERLAAETAAASDGPVRLHVEHALGELAVGEIPIVIVAGAGHRPQAFDLCRNVLEALKSEVPIYGEERSEDGRRWKVNT